MSIIVVDAGHGGTENGAIFGDRLEKDDNLALALEVEKALKTMGQTVIMTRTDDKTVSLSERANIANNSNADLFISLHRDSFTEQTEWTNGVTNYVQNGSPDSYIKAAEMVLEEVVNVGVQSNKGVREGNYYVLRNTKMPSMLLEMGYINNKIDNELFDEHLKQYGWAIAEGIVDYLSTVPPYDIEQMKRIQRMLNQRYNTNLTVDGIYGPKTQSAIVKGLQTELNSWLGISLKVDGIFGSATKAATPLLGKGSWGPIVALLQSALVGNGYNVGSRIDGIFGTNTQNAVKAFQSNNNLKVDGIAGPNTFEKLLTKY